MNFQKIIILIATILLIIALIFIGYTLYNHKFNKKFPPIIGDCPDSWVSENNVCNNPDNLGAKCSGPMNFNQSKFKGNEGNCNKAKWANSCNVSWSGITNDPNICKSVNDN